MLFIKVVIQYDSAHLVGAVIGPAAIGSEWKGNSISGEYRYNPTLPR